MLPPILSSSGGKGWVGISRPYLIAMTFHLIGGGMTDVSGDIDETIISHVSMRQGEKVQGHCLYVLPHLLISLGLAYVPEQ